MNSDLIRSLPILDGVNYATTTTALVRFSQRKKDIVLCLCPVSVTILGQQPDYLPKKSFQLLIGTVTQLFPQSSFPCPEKKIQDVFCIAAHEAQKQTGLRKDT